MEMYKRRRILGFCSVVTLVFVMYLIAVQKAPDDQFVQSLGVRQHQVAEERFRGDNHGHPHRHHIQPGPNSQPSSPNSSQRHNAPTRHQSSSPNSSQRYNALDHDVLLDINKGVTKSAEVSSPKQHDTIATGATHGANRGVTVAEEDNPSEAEEVFQQSDRKADDIIKGEGRQSGSAPIVLVVAYLRTGSTFTASLFTQSREAFYVFEPLHIIYDLVKAGRPVLYINGTARRYGADLSDDVIADTLQHWFHCSLSHIDKSSLMDSFHNRYSVYSMKPFVVCVKHRMSVNPSMTYAIKECLPETERKCHTANVKIFKTIRTKFEVVEKLLALNPTMKVLHLVRDPRGMFNSQVRNFKKMNIISQVKNMCSRILNNLEISKRISRNHPENIKLVRYEDLANNPLQVVQDLYEFTNMELSDAVKQYVVHSTSSNLTDNCPYCTRRQSSSKTASKWRDALPSHLMTIINKHCGPLFIKLGYVQFANMNQIRDHSLATTISRERDTNLLVGGS